MEQKKLSEVLTENKIKVRKKEIARIKAEKKVNRKLNFIISLLLIAALISLLSLNKKMTDRAMESCLNNGQSTNYCESHL